MMVAVIQGGWGIGLWSLFDWREGNPLPLKMAAFIICLKWITE